MSEKKKKERERGFALTNGHCYYCGCKITLDDFHKDHFQAWSRVHRNEGNRVPACRDCNTIKSYHKPERIKEILKKYKTGNIQVRLMDKYRDKMDEQGKIFSAYCKQIQ